MSPLPATMAFTAKSGFLGESVGQTRRIPLSCVVVVVRTMSSLGFTGLRRGGGSEADEGGQRSPRRADEQSGSCGSLLRDAVPEGTMSNVLSRSGTAVPDKAAGSPARHEERKEIAPK